MTLLKPESSPSAPGATTIIASEPSSNSSSTASTTVICPSAISLISPFKSGALSGHASVSFPSDDWAVSSLSATPPPESFPPSSAAGSWTASSLLSPSSEIGSPSIPCGTSCPASPFASPQAHTANPMADTIPVSNNIFFHFHATFFIIFPLFCAVFCFLTDFINTISKKTLKNINKL